MGKRSSPEKRRRCGRPHRGKSWLVAAIALAVATQTLCLCKLATRFASVIYIDEDTPTSILEWRFDRLCRFLGLSRQSLPLFLWSMTGFRLDAPPDLQKLITTIKALPQPVLVVIDTLDSVLGGLDTNKTKDSVRVGQLLSELKACGATLLVTHHMSIHGLDDEKSAAMIKISPDARWATLK